MLLLAKTITVAINIDDTTIYPALHIPGGTFWKSLPALNEKTRSSLRIKFSKVKSIDIHEILTVFIDFLFHIHQQLLEISWCPNNTPRASITIIALGNIFPLPPARSDPVYAQYDNGWQNLISLWSFFGNCKTNRSHATA